MACTRISVGIKKKKERKKNPMHIYVRHVVCRIYVRILNTERAETQIFESLILYISHVFSLTRELIINANDKTSV